MTNLSEMSKDQLLALVTQMQAAQSDKITLKVGQSGTLCMYHGARYPVALYAEQWERIITYIKSGKVEAFIAANADKLSRRDAKA